MLESTRVPMSELRALRVEVPVGVQRGNLLAVAPAAVNVSIHASISHRTAGGTAIPVRVTNLPAMDSAVAWATLWIALATLVAVMCQILLARKELDVVREDLKNNRKMMDEAFRRPDLQAAIAVFNKIYDPNESKQRVNGLEYPPFYTVNMQITVSNRGKRPTGGFMLELLTPLDKTIYRTNSEARVIDGVKYVANLNYNREFSMYPFGNTLSYMQAHRFRTDAGSVTVLWRLYDDFGQYPADGFGSATFIV